MIDRQLTYGRNTQGIGGHALVRQLNFSKSDSAKILGRHCRHNSKFNKEPIDGLILYFNQNNEYLRQYRSRRRSRDRKI